MIRRLVSVCVLVIAAAGCAPPPESGQVVGVAQLRAGGGDTCVVLLSGAVRCTTPIRGGATEALDGVADAVDYSAPSQCVLHSDGSVSCRQSNGTRATVAGLDDVVDIAGYCAVLAGGAVACFGPEDGDPVVPVAGIDTAVSMVHPLSMDLPAPECAILADGTAECWGAGDYGPIESLDGLVQAEMYVGTEPALNRGCALRTDTRVWCWGRNNSGQAGDGTQEFVDSPTAVSGLIGVNDIAVAQEHTCATTEIGAAFCWGSNEHYRSGQLGLGQYSTPREIPGVSGAVDVSVGIEHSCVRFGDTTVKCVGRDKFGQLGRVLDWGGVSPFLLPLEY